MEKITDLRKLDTKKLTETLKEKQTDLLEKRIIRSTGKTKDTSVFSKLRKDIARVKTVIKEKEILSSNEVKGESNA